MKSIYVADNFGYVYAIDYKEKLYGQNISKFRSDRI